MEELAREAGTPADYPYACRTLARLGARSWINAENWSTTIGGSYMEPAAVEAMAEAAASFFDMSELMDRACIRVAELCGVEVAYITSGAAAGLVLASAACIVGSDTRKMAMLFGGVEGRESLPNEIIMQAPHSSHYDYQYHTGGARVVRVGFPFAVERHMVEDAISDRTVALAYVHSYQSSPRELPFATMAEIARDRNLPLLVDTAAILPPKANLHRFTDEGADLVVISGGKAIKGPNNTGLVLGGGRYGPSLIEAIRKMSFPGYGIGRPLKVSKEAIAGLLAALEVFVATDEDAMYARQMEVCRQINAALAGISGLHTRVIPNDGRDFEHPISAHVPRVYMEWEPETLGFDAAGLDRIMASEDPPIRLRKPRLTQANTTTSRSIRLVDSYYLREPEVAIVIRRLSQAFGGKRST